MDFGIAGKVALVSGGSKGIGRRCAEMLGAERCKVIVAARGQAGIGDTVRAITAAGGKAVGVSADLRCEEDVVRVVTTARKTFGDPDIVIANLYGPGSGNLSKHPPKDFVEAFRDLALSITFLARETLPHMKRQRWGRLVMLGSSAAMGPPTKIKHMLANTARADVVSLYKSLANEFGKYGIAVNTLGTGGICTERMHDYLKHVAEDKGTTKESVLQMINNLIPVGRPGTPEDMASLALFLCSRQAAHITGSLITISGSHERSAS